MPKTKVLPSEWKGQPMFAIFKVDEEGNKKKDGDGQFLKPKESFGIKRAIKILEHLDELKAYVDECSE